MERYVGYHRQPKTYLEYCLEFGVSEVTPLNFFRRTVTRTFGQNKVESGNLHL